MYCRSYKLGLRENIYPLSQHTVNNHSSSSFLIKGYLQTTTDLGENNPVDSFFKAEKRYSKLKEEAKDRKF